MKCQDLFSLKNKNKNLECRLLQILIGTLRVNYPDELSIATDQYVVNAPSKHNLITFYVNSSTFQTIVSIN